MTDRRTSAYLLRLNIGESLSNLHNALDTLRHVAVVSPLTDSHVNLAESTIAIGFRAAGDTAACTIAEETVRAFWENTQAQYAGWELLTGHGVHRRSVATVASR